MPQASPKRLVGVIGAGAMGTGIAQVAAAAGHSVLLFDVQPNTARQAKKNISTQLNRRIGKGSVSKTAAQELLARIQPISALIDLSPVDIAIEAIVENLEIKVDLFRNLESHLNSSAILASNTSSISITEIASKLQHPQRFIGMHFFNPAPAMPLVEIISGLQTHPECLQQVSTLAKAWGKTPVACKSAPGFIVNRGARPFYNEALKFMEESDLDPVTLDALIRANGFRMGPFELIDLIGLDINLSVGESLWQAYYGDPKYRPSVLLKEKVAAQHLGRKTGQGFYNYQTELNRAAQTLAPCSAPTVITIHGDLGAAKPLINLWREHGIKIKQQAATDNTSYVKIGKTEISLSDGRMANCLTKASSKSCVVFDFCLDYSKCKNMALARSATTSDEEFKQAVGLFQALGIEVSVVADLPGLPVIRTLCMLISEASDTVLKKIATVEDVDTAMQKGLNYPGGPLQWADQIGLGFCVQVLDNLQDSYGDDRYRASLLLKRMALSGERFYA